MEKSKGNKSNMICPEIAHLIDSEHASTTVSQFDNASVTVTTFLDLEAAAGPWRTQTSLNEEESEDEEVEEVEDELPGMSLKPIQEEKVKVTIGNEDRKALNRSALKKLQESKAYKIKEKLKAKKQRNASRFKKKTMSKKAKHLKKIGGLKKD